jgi:hypothetical protein
MIVIPQSETVEVGRMYIIERKPGHGDQMEYIAARCESDGNLTYLHDWHVVDVARIKSYGWRIFGPVSIGEGEK